MSNLPVWWNWAANLIGQVAMICLFVSLLIFLGLAAMTAVDAFRSWRLTRFYRSLGNNLFLRKSCFGSSDDAYYAVEAIAHVLQSGRFDVPEARDRWRASLDGLTKDTA